VSAFDQLHPAVQYHIVNSLGWRELRPTQLEAIEPILSGHDCLLLAPTAGGKTEAAVFPVMSRMVAEDWRGLSVLYLCPIKALLNNLEHRLSKYLALLGRRVGVWHGDIAQASKSRMLRDPPDVLLTTPESLEGMLISRKVEQIPLLGGVRSIIVDELHAFAGDDRGWHMRSLLGRLRSIASGKVQIIGLTATVGNPQELIDWLTTGSGGKVVGRTNPSVDAEIEVDFVGSTVNAALVISRLHQGEKRLVFCDSRSRVEDLARELRALGTRTFVSHSSLSADERRQAEAAFGEARDCVIVATSTLELGIDVGDLDRVIQIDAPGSVSSFLQRMGRTGRRSGSNRNCVFLATSETSLLMTLAIVSLWKSGYVEQVRSPAEPWHVVLQQMLALLLEHGALPEHELICKTAVLFPELSLQGIQDLGRSLCERSILWSNEGVIWFGPQGEKEFGRRNFMGVTSVFVSPPQFVILHGQAEVGFVSPVVLLPNADRPNSISLAGRAWRISSIDWKGKRAWVEPTDSARSTRWDGGARGIRFEVAQQARHILATESQSTDLSRRAAETFDAMRQRYEFVTHEAGTVLAVEKDRLKWWTFGGLATNYAIMEVLRRAGIEVRSADDLSLTLPTSTRRDDLERHVRELRFDRALPNVGDDALESIKFAKALPPVYRSTVVHSRLLDVEHARVLCQLPLIIAAAHDT
jgi:ATP-dependent helicase Lhr and Lhr-like helicase